VKPELERFKKEMNQDGGFGEGEYEAADPEFPVNPTLLLAPMLQTARARSWQVLPGRTHPLMTSRGGAEGFLFTATRVLPVEGKVEARGRFRAGKKRKMADVASLAWSLRLSTTMDKAFMENKNLENRMKI
jgi:tRNA (adenine-N(1)-)-methyltransferase non-catalytic subunit